MVAFLVACALSGCGGSSGGDDVPAVLPAITSFIASADVLERGETVTLTAVFEGGEGFVNEGGGPVVSGVPLDLVPYATTVYTLTVEDGLGNVATAQASVRVFDRVFRVASEDDAGPFTLRHAIALAEAVAPGTSAIVFDLVLPATITLESALPPIRADVSLLGPGTVADLTVSGNGTHRVFFVDGGRVSFEGMTIADGAALGGNGGGSEMGSAGGGGGAGMGGGIFVNGGDVRVVDVAMSGNAAMGGSGGRSGTELNGAGGGGGTSGDGEVSLTDDGGDGGHSGPFGGVAGAGGVSGGAGPTAGGEGAGGGGSANYDGAGGSGGFGGGGGGGWSTGGHGGFGGGGGGSDNPLYGSEGAGGAFAGSGNPGSLGGGGGGAGLGGALFVREGRVVLERVTFTSNTASGGAGGGVFFFGGPGLGKGGAVFVLDPAEVTGLDLSFTGNAASDDLGAPGDDDDAFGLVAGP